MNKILNRGRRVEKPHTRSACIICDAVLSFLSRSLAGSVWRKHIQAFCIIMELRARRLSDGFSHAKRFSRPFFMEIVAFAVLHVKGVN